MIRRPGIPDPRLVLPALASAITVALVAAPWVLGFSGSRAAVAGHIAFAMGIAPIAVLITSLAAAAAGTTIAGLWLALSPWVLGYAGRGVAAWGIDLIAGLALIALAVVALRLVSEPEPGLPDARIGRS
jgi:hypothetical protein